MCSQTVLDEITGKVVQAAGDSLGDKLDKGSYSAYAPGGLSLWNGQITC